LRRPGQVRRIAGMALADGRFGEAVAAFSALLRRLRR
jgi:hypothetical protein